MAGGAKPRAAQDEFAGPPIQALELSSTFATFDSIQCWGCGSHSRKAEIPATPVLRDLFENRDYYRGLRPGDHPLPSSCWNRSHGPPHSEGQFADHGAGARVRS